MIEGQDPLQTFLVGYLMLFKTIISLNPVSEIVQQ